MKFILPKRSILSRDGWRALKSSIWGRKDASVIAEQRLAKALSQRNEARAQRDKTRLQRDDLQDEVSELRLRVAELEERGKAPVDARHALADAINMFALDDPARCAALLKTELIAESARVQELERNLDRVLRRSVEMEAKLSRTRAMLVAATDEGDVDLRSIRIALGLDDIYSASAPAPDNPSATAARGASDGPAGQAANARIEPGSSTFDVAADDERTNAAAGSNGAIARLPEPVVMNGERLTPGRARRVAEDRQLQIDSFVADGEFARIQALKDIHEGRRAFILGNGPSLDHHDLSKLDGEITFVANWFANHEGFDRIKPSYYAIPSHEMFGGWARQNPVLNKSFVKNLTRHHHKPEMFFSHRFRESLQNEPALDGYERRFLVFDRPKFLADEAGGLEFDLGRPMHDGYTALLTFCVPLAVHMGITEIYMVGCDYGVRQNAGARSDFHAPSEHPKSLTRADNSPLFRVYELAREGCATRGVKIFNATAGGELEGLPRIGYDDVLSARSVAAGA